MRHKQKNLGFTLIELLVVIAIIALLSSIVMASLSRARLRAINAAIIQNITQYRTALELYRLQNNRLPPLTTNQVSCVGDYPDATHCGYAGSVSDETLCNANQLGGLIRSCPPVSTRRIGYQSGGIGFFYGATYQVIYRCSVPVPNSGCAIVNGQSNSYICDQNAAGSPGCVPQEAFRWWLDGQNRSCGAGIQADVPADGIACAPGDTNCLNIRSIINNVITQCFLPLP